MSNFDSISINDSTGTPRDVGGKYIDSVFHESVMPVNGIIADTGDFNLSTTPTVVTLIGVEDFLLVDLGTNDTNSEIFVALQYRASGDWIAPPIIPIAPFDVQNRVNANPGGSGLSLNYTPVSIRTYTSDTTGRVFLVPCLGAEAFRIRMSSGTLNAVRVKHLVGVPPVISAMTQTQQGIAQCYAFPGITATAYATGKVIAGTQHLGMPFNTPQLMQYGSPKITALQFATNGAVIGDFDILVAGPDDNSAQSDNATFNLDYAASVVGYFEVRAAPTGDQLKLLDLGASGGKGCMIHDVNLPLPYFTDMSGTLTAADVIIVARGSFTPSASSGLIQAMVEY